MVCITKLIKMVGFDCFVVVGFDYSKVLILIQHNEIVGFLVNPINSHLHNSCFLIHKIFFLFSVEIIVKLCCYLIRDRFNYWYILFQGL